MELPFKFVWERFPTAIKIDRIPSLFWSRAAQALALRVGYCDLEFTIA